MSFRVVIPARYASTRLPGKPLREIGGSPMIQHVYEHALESGASQVVVATDDERIATAVAGFGGEAVLTANTHRSGTERLAEVVGRLGWPDEEVVVNLQGDEPQMPPALVHQVALDLQDRPGAQVSTLRTRIHTAAELFDPHVVKVVVDAEGYGLYFSRAAIPWDRDAFSVTQEELPERSDHWRHLGIYAYRAGYIGTYVDLPASPLEEMESLEQLRVLWHGGRIHVAEAQVVPGHGVDTLEDLERARRALA